MISKSASQGEKSLTIRAFQGLLGLSNEVPINRIANPAVNRTCAKSRAGRLLLR